MNNRGQTPLYYAQAKGKKVMVEFLRQHGGHE
jgi:ankyrin repeat protein